MQITSASGQDGGNYTCSPHNIHPDSVNVNIMDGEGTSAAVHKDEASAAYSPRTSPSWTSVLLVYVLRQISDTICWCVLYTSILIMWYGLKIEILYWIQIDI